MERVCFGLDQIAPKVSSKAFLSLILLLFVMRIAVCNKLKANADKKYCVSAPIRQHSSKTTTPVPA
jgi:hypothetical protein